MINFHYQGSIPASKSLMNRALIVQSYFPEIQLFGDCGCDDVAHMKSSLAKLSAHTHLNCGEGGTTFRFLTLRASRNKGEHFLTGTERLLHRPQRQLQDILEQLGVKSDLQKEGLALHSEGWSKPAGSLHIDTSTSSQFASAVLLNCWNLEFDLEFQLTGLPVSESYFAMTLQMVESFGMKVIRKGSSYMIPAKQAPQLRSYRVESDLSSTFTIAVAGALCGEVIIENFPLQSLQPDRAFVDIFKKMNVNFEMNGSTLKVKKSPSLAGCEWNLSSCPDLFPLLAVLAAHAEGPSRFFGAPHLVSKESDRIQKVADLFDLIGVKYQKKSDGMEIFGRTKNQVLPLIQSGYFDPDQDHRMVMAAMVFRMLGHQFHLEDPQAINKSFPEFWSIVGVHP